jgi:ABC-2 type transport system permease protein
VSEEKKEFDQELEQTEKTENTEIVEPTENTETVDPTEKIQNMETVEKTEKAEKKAKPKKKKENSIGKKIKASFQSRMFHNGGYSTVVILAVIIIAVLVNLFVEKLDLKVDMSTEGLYTLTEESEKIAADLENDITIYYVIQSGSEDTMVQEILNRYEKLSKHIKVETKDPVLYPKFVSNYTTEDSSNCVIVVNDDTDISKYISYYDMINYSTDYTTYQTTATDIDIEGKISSAIKYVTSEDVPVVYQITGHGETELGSTLQNEVEKLNVDLQTLTSVSAEEIPEDCDMLLINGPTNDFTEDEVTMIEDYLKAGGNAAIFVNYTESDMTNFESLLAYYGITMAEGIVVETSGNYMGNYPTYILPDVKTAHDIVTSVNNENKNVIMPIAKGLLEEQVRDTIEFTNFLVSSDGAYSKTDMTSSTVSKEKGDIDGPFNLGIAVEESYDDAETKLAVFGSAYLLDDSMISTNQFGNADLLLDTINWMVEHEAGLNIATKSIEQQYVTVQPAQIGFWGVLLVIVLPVLILVAGIVVWMRRRKA